MLVNENCVTIFVFFKQKTAYEMRISDWSSDVCSSDLLENPAHHRPDAVRPEDRVHADGIDRRRAQPDKPSRDAGCPPAGCDDAGIDRRGQRGVARIVGDRRAAIVEAFHQLRDGGGVAVAIDAADPARSSEEHTSELQSLMSISYAVFCLKKKKNSLKKVQRTNEACGNRKVHTHTPGQH